MGSEPNWGFSSTEKSENSKPGSGSNRSLTEEICTWPADAAADAVGNSVLIAADVDQRRQHKGHHRQHDGCQQNPAPGRRTLLFATHR